MVRLDKNILLTWLRPSRNSQLPAALPASSSTVDLKDVRRPPSARLGSAVLARSASSPGTSLAALPSPDEVKRYNPQAFRRRLGELQLLRARTAYQSSHSCNEAGEALVALAPQVLVSMGITPDAASAAQVVSALCAHGIVDEKGRVSRGDTRDLSPTEVEQALRTLPLSSVQRSMACDALKVCKFLYDYGIREAANAFDLELCGDAQLTAAQSEPANWERFAKTLFDPQAQPSVHAALQARLIDLSRS